MRCHLIALVAFASMRFTAHGQDASAVVQQGHVALSRKAYSEAIQNFTTALSLGLTKEVQCTVRTQRGLAYLAREEWEHAIRDFNLVLAEKPKSLDALGGRGMAYTELHQAEKAIADLDTAIALNNKLALLYRHRAEAYQTKGDLAKAMKDADESIRLEPGEAKGYITRAAIHLASGSLDNMLADFDKAMEINPEVAEVEMEEGAGSATAVRKLLTGYKAQKEKKMTEAIAAYDEALMGDLAPRMKSMVLCNRALASYELGGWTECMADATAALKADPSNVEALGARAMALEKLGRKDEALRDYTDALDLQPNHVSIRNNRGTSTGKPAG